MVQRGNGSILIALIPRTHDLVQYSRFCSVLDTVMDLLEEADIKYISLGLQLQVFSPLSPAKYYFYDNYFDLPGALLCARVVDMLHKVKFKNVTIPSHIYSLKRPFLNKMSNI